MKKSPIKTFRVLVTRHYIATDWYDVQASTPAKAKRAAEATVRKLRRDARAAAVDNGWIGSDPIEVPRPGHYSNDLRYKVREVAPGVFSHMI